MLSGSLLDQEHLGTLVADAAGCTASRRPRSRRPAPAAAAALRVGTMAVASGFHDIVIVAGLEKMTDTVGKDTTAGLATAADAEYEALHGVSFVGLNALIMQRYMYEYDVPLDAFAGFSINAHRNGANNPNAMFQDADQPQGVCQRAGDRHAHQHDGQQPGLRRRGGARLGPDRVARRVHHRPSPRAAVQILASASANDTLAVHDRQDPLFLEAALREQPEGLSRRQAWRPRDLDLFELHDAFTIMSALSLEATGFARARRGLADGAGGRDRHSRLVCPSARWAG